MQFERHFTRDEEDQPVPVRPSLSRRLETSRAFSFDPADADADPWRAEPKYIVDPDGGAEAADEESIWNLAYPSPVRAAWEHARRQTQPSRADRLRKMVPPAGSRGRTALLGGGLLGAVMLVLLAAQGVVARFSGPGDPIGKAQETPDSAAAEAFQSIWQRVDFPVSAGEAHRSWVWGPEPLASGRERFSGSADGTRWVQYYDKGRLERADGGDVTSGLLVRELVSGQLAIGDAPGDVDRRKPAQLPVAGDAGGDAPTYASFRAVASLEQDKTAEARLGAPIVETIDRRGTVGKLPDDMLGLGERAHVAEFDARLGHNIPDVFWAFLNQKALVYDSGSTALDQPLFAPWEAVVGLPLTEPYWVQAQLGGQPRWVLVQLFERRVLTFTPDNAPEYQVEMGNVGRHYWQWRYGTDLPAAPLD